MGCFSIISDHKFGQRRCCPLDQIFEDWMICPKKHPSACFKLIVKRTYLFLNFYDCVLNTSIRRRLSDRAFSVPWQQRQACSWSHSVELQLWEFFDRTWRWCGRCRKPLLRSISQCIWQSTCHLDLSASTCGRQQLLSLEPRQQSWACSSPPPLLSASLYSSFVILTSCRWSSCSQTIRMISHLKKVPPDTAIHEQNGYAKN